MKAVIIAAGEGKRLRPLTEHRPKPLVEIQGKPLILFVWETLPQEVEEVIVVIGYKGEMLRSYIGDQFHGKKVIFVEQKELLGQAHALHLCKKYLETEEKFLVLFADDLQDQAAIKKLAEYESAVLTCQVKDPSHFGIIVTDERGVIKDMEEKPKNPKSNLAATGVYILTPEIFKYYKKEREAGFEYYLAEMLKEHMLDTEYIAVESRFWIPIAYPEDIEKAEKIFNKIV